jgi:HD-like signal output (HDOD) protein
MEKIQSFMEIVNESLASEKTVLLPFDRTSMNIQQEIARSDPDVNHIEKLISSDQALTGQVLRTANSGFYIGLSKVSTIHDAIVRLGIKEVADLVTLVTHRESFRSKDPLMRKIMEQLWQHSVGCAVASRWLAKRCGFRELSSEAFIAGLLHDVGKLFLLTVIENIKDSKKSDLSPTTQLLEEVMNTMHTEQGYLLMKNWNLPESFSEVTRDHHLEEIDPRKSLLVLVRVANKACNKMGVGMKEDPSISLAATTDAHQLGLTEVLAAELEIKIEDSMTLTR